MSELTNEWKKLKPQVGIFLSNIEKVLKGCSDVETMLQKREEKAYEKAYNKALDTISKKELCPKCPKAVFFAKHYGQNIYMLDKFEQLSKADKNIVESLINSMLYNRKD